MKRTKYRNTKTTVDGIVFDSKKEAARYGELKLLELAGEISQLGCQPKFVLQGAFPDARVGLTKAGKPRMVRAITFKADFKYWCKKQVRWVVDDVKSPASKTEAYEIRKRLFLGMHKGVDFREV
jgi:hypothetical protein